MGGVFGTAFAGFFVIVAAVIVGVSKDKFGGPEPTLMIIGGIMFG